MARASTGVIVAVVAWFIVATLVNFAFRLWWPGYGEAENALKSGAANPAATFTLAMLIARLAMGAVATITAGITVAAIARGNLAPAKILGVLLVALFVPTHYALWDRFPLWYHAVFLLSLFPVTLLGAMLTGWPRRAIAAG